MPFLGCTHSEVHKTCGQACFIQSENSAVMMKPGYEAKQKIVSDEKRLGPGNYIQCLFYLCSEHAQVSNKVVLFSLL